MFGLIWKLFGIFHFLRLMQIFGHGLVHQRIFKSLQDSSCSASCSASSITLSCLFIVFGVLDYIILLVFSEFHFLCRMQIFHLEWSFREASDRFGTKPIVSAIIKSIILHIFRVFQLQHGPTIGYLRVWRFGMDHNFGMDERIILK